MVIPQHTCEPESVLGGEWPAQSTVLGAQQFSARLGDCGRMEGSVGVLLLTQECHLGGVWGVVELLRSHLDGMDDGVSHFHTHVWQGISMCAMDGDEEEGVK